MNCMQQVVEKNGPFYGRIHANVRSEVAHGKDNFLVKETPAISGP